VSKYDEGCKIPAAEDDPDGRRFEILKD